MERLPSLSCFFPAYNEEPNIARLLDEVVATLPQFADQWEAVIVDDGSTDRTASIVRDYTALHPEIRLVQHKNNLGYGHALRTGLKESTGEAVFFTDADLQFHLSEIGELESRSAFISPELVIRAQIAGFRLTEVGVTHYPRTAGKSGGASLKVISRTIQEMRRLRADLKANKTN